MLVKHLKSKVTRVVLIYQLIIAILTGVYPPIKTKTTNNTYTPQSVILKPDKTKVVEVDENYFKKSSLTVKGGDLVNEAAQILFDIAVILVFCYQNKADPPVTFIPNSKRKKAPDLSIRNRYEPSKKNPHRKRADKISMNSDYHKQEINSSNSATFNKRQLEDYWMKEVPTLTCARDDTSRELKLGSMQIANKLYHAPQFHSSLNPSNIGMRQSDLDKLSKSSILEYMNDEKNTKIPPSYVKAFQKQLQVEIMRTDIDGRYIYSLDDRSLYQSKLALLLHSPILSAGPSIDKRIQLVFQKSGKFWTLNALSEGQYNVGSKAHSFGKHGKKSF